MTRVPNPSLHTCWGDQDVFLKEETFQLKSEESSEVVRVKAAGGKAMCKGPVN